MSAATERRVAHAQKRSQGVRRPWLYAERQLAKRNCFRATNTHTRGNGFALHKGTVGSRWALAHARIYNEIIETIIFISGRSLQFLLLLLLFFVIFSFTVFLFTSLTLTAATNTTTAFVHFGSDACVCVLPCIYAHI